MKRIAACRSKFARGNEVSQTQIDGVAAELQPFRELLLPGEKEETFQLVDQYGGFRAVFAPRWLCHLLGLRHKVAHVVLHWRSPALGPAFVLQVRSWNKIDSPGALDISVGGHVNSGEGTTVRATASREMAEELGLQPADLLASLAYRASYETQQAQPDKHFCDVEHRDIFVGELKRQSLERISFSDREVVGLYLCPQREAENLLQQNVLAMASGLRKSLPFCLDMKI